jgi:hypothetical protein
MNSSGSPVPVISVCRATPSSVSITGIGGLPGSG